VPAGQYEPGTVRTDGNYPVHHFDKAPPSFRVGKKLAGRSVDGTRYDEFPDVALAA
jgi:hypothetical protein